MTACQSKTHLLTADIPPLPPQVSGTSDAIMMRLQQKLSVAGVRVITVGQKYLIVIPSDLLFNDGSPQISWGSYGVLNDVVCYLQQFRKVSINIKSYSVPRAPLRDKALTCARARAIADYIWSQGVDSRLIFTQGMGSGKPIIMHSTLDEKSLNSRIEITFINAVA